MTGNKPAFLENILGEVESNYWKPQSLNEWVEMKKTNTMLSAWDHQQSQERGLRKLFGIWAFILISLQLVFIIAAVISNGLGI